MDEFFEVWQVNLMFSVGVLVTSAFVFVLTNLRGW